MVSNLDDGTVELILTFVILFANGYFPFYATIDLGAQHQLYLAEGTKMP